MTNSNTISSLTENAISLLKGLIATPSFSKEEDNTADLIENFLQSNLNEYVRTTEDEQPE